MTCITLVLHIVENVGLVAGISTLSHSRPEILLLPVSGPPFCFYGYMATENDVGTCFIASGIIKNMDTVFGILLKGHL